MTDRELLKQALEALDSDDPTIQLRAAVAIRAALAEPEQEPVCDKDPQGCWSIRCQLGKVCKNIATRCEYIRGDGMTHWCVMP